MLLYKLLILLVLGLILISLFTGAFFLGTETSEDKRVVKLLTIRISLSLLLFILLWVGYGLGWIRPHGIIQPLPPTANTNKATTNY